MTARVEELARQIESLAASDLQALLERVEEMSFRMVLTLCPLATENV